MTAPQLFARVKTQRTFSMTRGARASLVVVVLVTLLCYWPGLSGSFLFDDFVNLDALGKRGPIDNWPAFWRYLTSGTADPLGRPLALLSFLLDANDWPAQPERFLRTNVWLHVINGLLLFGLVRKLERSLRPASDGNCDFIAILTSGLWLLHPLFVSTTLYAVQREAMLPATFTFAGLWLYLDGRERFLTCAAGFGLWRMLLGVIAGTALATLSKANGILLPLLAGSLTATAISSSVTGSSDDRRAALASIERWLLFPPILAVLAYLLSFAPLLSVDLEHRPWTIGERLLTEPRMLTQYLWLLFVPHPLSTGLYNDDIAASTGLLHPASTLVCIVFTALLLLLALLRRRQWPRFAAAILFFFGGHVLESTVVPLELYFEHRNYLPAALIFWPLSHLVATFSQSERLRIAAATALLLLLATTTLQRALLWGQPEQLAIVWAARNPESSRALSTAALVLIRNGEARRAAAMLDGKWRETPNDVQIAFNYVAAKCAIDGAAIDAAESARVARTLSTATSGHLLVHQWLKRALQQAHKRECAGLDLATVAQWIDATTQNPVLSNPKTRDQDIEPLLGELATYRNDPEAASLHFLRAIRSYPNPDFAARMVSFLATNGHYREALQVLDTFEAMQPLPAGNGMPWLHQYVLRKQGFWEHEFRVLRGKLINELNTSDQQSRPNGGNG